MTSANALTDYESYFAELQEPAPPMLSPSDQPLANGGRH